AVYEARARTREIAFLRRRKPLEQRQRNGAIQHGIADELEPFVVGNAEAAVGEGLAQEAGLAKFVTEPFRQCHSAKVSARRMRQNPAGCLRCRSSAARAATKPSR